jgi:hypothetical protein
VLKRLMSADLSGSLLALSIAAMYSALPLGVLLVSGIENEFFVALAQLAAVGAICIYLGSKLGLLDPFARAVFPIVRMEVTPFVIFVWGAFLVFVAVACATAEKIPFVAALQGADPETLVVLRERFLKAREGWQSSFVYINAILSGALVPYSLVLMLLHRHKYRWLCLGVFLLYCVSFVEKVYFMKAMVPVAYVTIQGLIQTRIRLRTLVASGVGVLALVTILSGVGTTGTGEGEGDFFSSSFGAGSPLAFMAWRSTAVPVFTAADALRVFEQDFGGRPLMGASSTFLAAIFGLERVDVEREVFAAQWGQTETETGNANSVYLTEAFVNFGYVGVVAFSLLIGLICRVFATSRDEALRSLWMLFAFSVFVSGLTGTLLSNGFLVVLALSAAVSFEAGDREPERDEPGPFAAGEPGPQEGS